MTGQHWSAVGLGVMLLASGAGAGTALAQSGETDATAGITVVPAATCDDLRDQFSSEFVGDLWLACYGNDTANPSCGLFSSADIPGQTNLLAFCQDSFPNGINVLSEPPLKLNVTIQGTTSGNVTGLNGVASTTAPFVFTPSNVLCFDFDDALVPPGTDGSPDKEVCVKIEPGTGGSDTECAANDFFQIVDGDCTVVQNVINATAGAAAGTASFALFTDVNAVGQAQSQQLLVCPNNQATCVTPPVSNASTGFPGGVQVRSQTTYGIVEENPDCPFFRNRRIC